MWTETHLQAQMYKYTCVLPIRFRIRVDTKSQINLYREKYTCLSCPTYSQMYTHVYKHIHKDNIYLKFLP